MLPVDRWPEAARTLGRTFGVRGAALRAQHEIRRAANAYRRAPRIEQRAWSPPASGSHYAVDAERLVAATTRDVARERGDRVASGLYHAYRWDWRALPESGEAWLRNPRTGYRYRADAPWWKVPHLQAAAGDIKDLWEPARFGWAYDLVRAALVTGDGRYAAAFGNRFGEWWAANPPFAGPHWSCGQETAIRAVALLYAEANLPHTAGLADALAASGERIADAVGYAVSQRNNHAISEAVGLVTLGIRFRGEHPHADAWLARGRRLLPRLINEQFAEDGWYIQHSFTYARLALDQCVVAERALRSIGDRLPAAAVARLARATELLLTVLEPKSGTVPNHGNNDGAFVHPITLADYRDFRPLITAASAMWEIGLPANVEPCREVLAWLDAAEPPPAPALGDGVWSGPSGWAAARLGRTQVFMRAGSYTSRPGHLDPLHLDVRFGRNEVVVDPGTFAYSAPAPWANALASARMHNGPMLDDREPGVRGPRFLWYLWPSARITIVRQELGEFVLEASSSGTITRSVRVARETVRVEDTVAPDVADVLTVRWLLHPSADAASLRIEGEKTLTQATEGSPRGWYSPAYGARIPSQSIEIHRPARAGATIITVIAPVTLK